MSSALEILTTEQKYVADLKTVVELYLLPLKNESFIKREEIEVLFTNLEAILLFNETLLSKEEVSTWKYVVTNRDTGALSDALGGLLRGETEMEDFKIIGQIFQDLAPYLRMYTTFCNGHAKSSEVKRKL